MCGVASARAVRRRQRSHNLESQVDALVDDALFSHPVAFRVIAGYGSARPGMPVTFELIDAGKGCRREAHFGRIDVYLERRDIVERHQFAWRPQPLTSPLASESA
jgi:hypothetical protein